MKPRFKTARCILYRDDQYLLAVHNRYWRIERRWGLPGGQVEWGESPRAAVARELEEELEIVVPELIEVGAWPYKRAMHMVFAAPLQDEIERYDDFELLDIAWFSEADVQRLKQRGSLHADYELDAIRRLRAGLAGASLAVAAG